MQPLVMPMPETLVDLEQRLTREIMRLADLNGQGASRWALNEQRAKVEEVRARRDVAREKWLRDWRIACLEQHWSNPGCEGR